MNNRKQEKCGTILHTFNDSINEEKIIFYSDASQATISALEFNEWYVVKKILHDWGYIVIEYPNDN